MTTNTHVSLSPATIVSGALALLAAGAGGAYLFLGWGGEPGTGDGRAATAVTSSLEAPPGPDLTPAPQTSATAPDVVVTLGQEAVDRAGITVSTVSTRARTTGVRLPGVVEPNAYKQVVVTPLVAGRVTRVLAELGQRVRRGQTMAQVFSPELVDAYARYSAARADLEAHERELRRVEELVKIGAASRQELERVHAEHVARANEVQGARSRLELLGVTAAVLDAGSTQAMPASVDVTAPIDGIVTERFANVGLNVDAGSSLFTVIDLSTVWVVASLYERDFASVRVGSPVAVTIAGYPDLALRGRIDYIDPQVSGETRTARVRVEVANPDNTLRLGMYADVRINQDGGAAVPVVSRQAVQAVGSRQVVYLASPTAPGRFTEREVHLGAVTGDEVEVLSGLEAGDVVVTEGSFSVRAERERVGARPSVDALPTAGATPAPVSRADGPVPAEDVRTVNVMVGAAGYQPAQISAQAGVPLRIVFTRTTDRACGTEVVVSSLGIRRSLPLNEPVAIEFVPKTNSTVAFACDMNMLHGSVVVR